MNFKETMEYLDQNEFIPGIEHSLTLIGILACNEYTEKEKEDILKKIESLYPDDISDIKTPYVTRYLIKREIQNCRVENKNNEDDKKFIEELKKEVVEKTRRIESLGYELRKRKDEWRPPVKRYKEEWDRDSKPFIQPRPPIWRDDGGGKPRGFEEPNRHQPGRDKWVQPREELDTPPTTSRQPLGRDEYIPKTWRNSFRN